MRVFREKKSTSIVNPRLLFCSSSSREMTIISDNRIVDNLVTTYIFSYLRLKSLAPQMPILDYGPLNRRDLRASLVLSCVAPSRADTSSHRVRPRNLSICPLSQSLDGKAQ